MNKLSIEELIKYAEEKVANLTKVIDQSAFTSIKERLIEELQLAQVGLDALRSSLKGDQVPVGEIVAWAGTNRDMGITREVDFRFLRFDVLPGTKLYAIEPAPAIKSDLLTRAQALAVETRALASRIQAGE